MNRAQVAVVEVLGSSIEVDSGGRLTWVERREEPVEGLVRTFTTRGTRAHAPGNSAVPVGDEEGFIHPALLNNPEYKWKLFKASSH